MKKIIFALFLFMMPGVVPLVIAQNQFEVLVYTSPDQYHNATIPTAITELKEMAKKHQFGLSWTQQPASFTDVNLGKFNVVVFLHSNESQLNDGQKESLRKFIRGGGGFVGIHAASVNAGQEEWYQKLIGRVFTGHPEAQSGVMSVHDHDFPASMHLPDKWLWTDEWYAFGEALTPGQNVLITVDESTYHAYKKTGTKEFRGMGQYHPISWYQYFDGGRSFFTALGHIETSYRDPWFLLHLYGGIYWAATGKSAKK